MGTLLLTACESDAHRLQRLKAERATVCLPVAQRDSAKADQALAAARIKSNSATTVEEATSDVVEVEHALAEMKRRIALTPEQRTHEDDSLAAARTSCELAERALNRFMAGR